MDAKTVREETIKPKLIEFFGTAMASKLIIAATGAGMKGKDEKEKLQLMVEAVCSDSQVNAMWGTAQVNKHKQEWLKLIP